MEFSAGTVLEEVAAETGLAAGAPGFVEVGKYDFVSNAGRSFVTNGVVSKERVVSKVSNEGYPAALSDRVGGLFARDEVKIKP